jgi:hypothetical protein
MTPHKFRELVELHFPHQAKGTPEEIAARCNFELPYTTSVPAFEQALAQLWFAMIDKEFPLTGKIKNKDSRLRDAVDWSTFEDPSMRSAAKAAMYGRLHGNMQNIPKLIKAPKK